MLIAVYLRASLSGTYCVTSPTANMERNALSYRPGYHVMSKAASKAARSRTHVRTCAQSTGTYQYCKVWKQAVGEEELGLPV